MLPAKPTIDDIRGLSQPNPSREAIEARAVHIATRMSDLPNTYRNLLPTTDDVGAIQAAEAAIRSAHAADVERYVAAEINPAAAKDISKLSATQRLELALRSEKPSGVRQAQAEPTKFGYAGQAYSPPGAKTFSRTQAIFESLSAAGAK